MPVSHKFSLICDEVRREDNGKFMIIGLYTPNVAVPQIPFVLPSLTFFNYLQADTAGEWDIRFRLTHLETGRNLAQGGGRIGARTPSPLVLPLRLGNVQLQAVGPYTFSLEVDSLAEPIVQTFDVILRIPQPPQGGEAARR